MRTKLLLLKTIFILFYFTGLSLGQNNYNCGTDEALKNNPALQQILENLEKEYKQKKQLNLTSLVPDMTTVYTIPLVFHVYHLGEAVGVGSNVSDASIQASVDRLNTVFRATGIHAGLTPDIKIQFVLASKTSNCDATNGIVRVDGRTITGYQANPITINDNAMHQSLRNLSSWDASKYINIRVCHNTNGYGWAYFLGDIFVEASAVSTITNVPGLDNFWAHEMGHSMNLYHTFQGDGTVNGGGSGTVAVCPVNTDPDNDGDKVSDTDPHKNNDGCNHAAINSCTGNAFGDILKNIMSYSCSEKFTSKQMERIRYALINYRAGLINSKGITGLVSPPVASSITKCSPGSATLRASGCTGTYNWYTASSGGSSLGTGASYTTPSLSSTTTYHVSCTETGTNCGISNRTPVQVVINSILSVSACTVSATNGLSNYFGISNFSIGTITYSGSSTTQLGTNYQDNTCTKTDLQAGNSYPFTLTGMYGNYMLGNIYIDYNNDGDFDDTNETAFEGSWGITQTGNIIPPSTATTNTYLRMRVMLDGGSITSCLLDGHPVYGSGLALDFAVKVIPSNCTTPIAPSVTSSSRCGTGTVTLSASGCTGTYNWYSANTGGTSLASTASYATPSISSTSTYYVDCTVGTCTSTRNSATATINIVPAPTVSPSFSRCGPGAITLSASGCTGTYNWRQPGRDLGTGSSYITPSTFNGAATFYVDCTIGGCTSGVSPTDAFVKIIPPAPTVSSTTINSGQTAILTAAGCTGTVNWYNAATNGTSLSMGASFTTPVLTTTTSYYADCSVNSCTSTTRGSGTVTVNATSCPVPIGMQWQNTFPTSFQPYWQGIAGNNYVVRYRISGTTNWTETGLIPCTQTGSVITTLSGLTNGQTYEWQVKTVCSGTNSSNYSTSTFSATFCREATLTAPTGTNLTATTANIQWNSTPVNVNLRYRIVGTTMWNTANNLTSSQTWLTGLSPNTNYEAQVQTICSGGILSAFTASINFTTLNCSNMYTLKTGNWNDITVWSCGRVPTSTDIITVKASHFITIPATYTANAKNVIFETGGKIIEAANTSKLCLSCPQIPTNGLIGYYPLNGNANDASGNGLNGSIVGSITSTIDRKGIANSAYQFSGVVLNYISIPDNALLCSNIITLNAWVNFAPSEGGYIINKGRDIQNGSYRLTSGSTSGQVLYNGINDASYASVPTNQWVMVTGIINGNNAKYYVNGVMVSQATLGSSYVCSSVGNPLTIGNHYYNGIPDVWAYPYKGKIDDVRIYNRALSDAEVLQIYNGEK